MSDFSSVVRIKAYSRYEYDYLSEIILRRADFQEHTIAEKDFKNMYPSDFEDLNLLLLQGHLDHLPGSDKRMLSTVVKLWTQTFSQSHKIIHKSLVRNTNQTNAVHHLLTTSKESKSLCIILEVLPEHPSDTERLTMKDGKSCQ
ncbi:hypothetical protein Tco_0379559 [Tanacetum coccineum]